MADYNFTQRQNNLIILLQEKCAPQLLRETGGGKVMDFLKDVANLVTENEAGDGLSKEIILCHSVVDSEICNENLLWAYLKGAGYDENDVNYIIANTRKLQTLFDSERGAGLAKNGYVNRDVQTAYCNMQKHLLMLRATMPEFDLLETADDALIVLQYLRDSPLSAWCGCVTIATEMRQMAMGYPSIGAFVALAVKKRNA